MSRINFDFSKIDETLQKKLVQGSVVPRPIAWITSKNDDGSLNLAPFSYFNMFSESVVGVSFQGNKRNQKDTYHNLMREKAGVIHIVSYDSIEVMDQSSFPYESNRSEVNELRLETIESKKVMVDSIQEAMIAMEVEVIDDISIHKKDSTEQEANLVLMRVLHVSVDEKVFDQQKQYILADKLNPLARLAGPHYAVVKQLDFKRKF